MDSEPGLGRGSHGPHTRLATGVAGSYGELDVPGLEAIAREQLAPSRSGQPARPTWVQVEILAALIARAHRQAGHLPATSDPRVLTVMEGIARVHGSAPHKKTALRCFFSGSPSAFADPSSSP